MKPLNLLLWFEANFVSSDQYLPRKSPASATPASGNYYSIFYFYEINCFRFHRRVIPCQILCFYAWFISHITISSSFIYVVRSDKISFLPFFCYSISSCIYISLKIHLLIKHIGWFQILAIVNSIATISGIQISF